MNLRRQQGVAWCAAALIGGAGFLGVPGVLAQSAGQPQPGASEPKPQQPERRGRREGPGREGSSRELPSREELIKRLKQRSEELEYLKHRVDELSTQLQSPEWTDQKLREQFSALRPGVRWFLLGGLGDMRESSGGGGDGEPGEGGRNRPWGPRGDHADFSKPVTPEDVSKALAWTDEHMPRLSSRLHELEKSDPEALNRIVQRMRPRIGELQRLAEENPEAAKIRIEDWQAGLQVVDAGRVLREKITAKAPQAEIDAARERVKAALAVQFDAQLAVQEADIVAFNARVDRAKTRLEERRSSRDSWLAERLSEIEAGEIEKPGKGK